MGYARLEARVDVSSMLQARPIGGVPRTYRREDFGITTISHPGKADSPVFGAEVPVEIRDTTCTFQKRSGVQLLVKDYRRLEFFVAKETAREHGIAEGKLLYVAELPLGQRRVHVAKFQKECRTRKPVIFEELSDLDPPFETIELRAAVSAGDAQRALQNSRVNYFSSEPGFTASLSDTELQNLASFDDGHPDLPRRRRDSTFSVACADDPDGLRNAILLDRNLLRSFEMTGEGKLNTPNNKNYSWIRLPPEVSSLAPQHLDFAVRQAMCGAGLEHARWHGRRVADYAAYLFHQHMLRALDRRMGEFFDSEGRRIDPPDDLSDPSWDFPDGT